MAIAMTTGVCTYIGLVVYTALRACPPRPDEGSPDNAYEVLRLLLPWASGRRNIDMSEDGGSDVDPQQESLSCGGNQRLICNCHRICLLTAREEIIGATLESRNVAVGFSSPTSDTNIRLEQRMTAVRSTHPEITALEPQD